MAWSRSASGSFSSVFCSLDMKAELYLDRGVERDCASWPDLALGLKLEREAVDIPVAVPAYDVEQDRFRILGEAVLRLPSCG